MTAYIWLGLYIAAVIATMVRCHRKHHFEPYEVAGVIVFAPVLWVFALFSLLGSDEDA